MLQLCYNLLKVFAQGLFTHNNARFVRQRACAWDSWAYPFWDGALVFEKGRMVIVFL